MNLSEMRQILGEREIQLTKSLGQNFLHDGHRGALRVWIGTNDNLVRKVEVEIQGNLGDGSDKHTIAITYRDYNANIKIEPPM